MAPILGGEGLRVLGMVVGLNMAILDQELFDSLTVGSQRRIPVRCDKCGAFRQAQRRYIKTPEAFCGKCSGGRPLKHPEGYYAKNKERWQEYDRARRTGDRSKYKRMRRDANQRRKEKLAEEARKAYDKVKPAFKEPDLYPKVPDHFPGFERWTLIPDFRNWETKAWLEVKMASTWKNKLFKHSSVHFPGLFFRTCRDGGARKNGYYGKHVDEQIELYPRPLTVAVYDGIRVKMHGTELKPGQGRWKIFRARRDLTAWLKELTAA